jgi:hypothetical protein
MTRHLPLLLLLVLAGGLQGQASPVRGPAVASGRLWTPPAPATVSPTALSSGILGDGSHDYRYRGFWIGAGLGVGLTWLSYEFCKGSDNGCQAGPDRVVLAAALTAGILGTVGALAGAQFDR